MIDISSMIDNQKISECLKSYFEEKGIQQKDIASRLGVSQAAVSALLNGKPFGKKVAEKWGNEFGIKPSWLITGEGEMLKKSAGKQPRTQEAPGTPVYNIDVVCGTEGRDLYFADERIIGYVDLPGINRSSHIIEASGDSMSPRINSGDRIVVREIETWDYFVYGQAYVIITDEYRLLKYVRKHPERPNEYVLLRSENLAYDDIELPIAAIRKLFVVENVLSVKNVL